MRVAESFDRAVLPGTGVRDAVAAAGVCTALGVVVATWAGWSSGVFAGLVVGMGIVVAAGVSVVLRPGSRCGPADRVTLARAVLGGGCAVLAVGSLTGGITGRSWVLLALLVPALALDGVDGLVARATGTASAAGARLDGEIDAALLLVLSLATARRLGWWVLAIGLMRYAFLAAGAVRPRQRGRLAFSQFRRVVAGIQGIAFALALAPIVPLPLGRTVVALALGLLMISFGRDVITLERRSPAATAGPRIPVHPAGSMPPRQRLRAPGSRMIRAADSTSADLGLASWRVGRLTCWLVDPYGPRAMPMEFLTDAQVAGYGRLGERSKPWEVTRQRRARLASLRWCG